jgi:hypothetical protein
MYESYVQLLPATRAATAEEIEEQISQYLKTLQNIASITDHIRQRVSILQESFSVTYIEENNEIFIHDVWGVRVNKRPVGMLLLHHFDNMGQYGICGEFSLKLNVYSDEKTESEYIDLKKEVPEESDFGETVYIFSQDQLIKLIRIPISIDPKRPVIVKNKLLSVAVSDVSMEDLVLVKKALRMFLKKTKECKKAFPYV